MKKYDILFLSIGIILSIIPIYVGLGWIYVCAIYPNLSQSETVAIFDSQILFNLFNGRYSSALFTLSCGFVAGILLLISLVYSLQNNGNKTLTIKVILFVINVIFTGWTLFGLM